MDDDVPRCPKCAAEMTTALMAAFCPRAKACEFWCEEIDAFLSDDGLVKVLDTDPPAAKPGE